MFLGRFFVWMHFGVRVPSCESRNSSRVACRTSPLVTAAPRRTPLQSDAAGRAAAVGGVAQGQVHAKRPQRGGQATATPLQTTRAAVAADLAAAQTGEPRAGLVLDLGVQADAPPALAVRRPATTSAGTLRVNPSPRVDARIALRTGRQAQGRASRLEPRLPRLGGAGAGAGAGGGAGGIAGGGEAARPKHRARVRV